MTKVRVKKSALDYFRRLARKSPLEIQAYLVGTVVSPTLTVIDSFHYTKSYATQTESMVGWYVEDYNRVSMEAEKQGKRVLGSIHSHPRWDAVMSPADHEVCVITGARIMGICSVDNATTNHRWRTRVRFWTTDSSLPCEIVYAKNKQGEKV